MNQLLADNVNKLRALCQRHGVKELSIFGSATRDDFDANGSDLDFLVQFEPQERKGFDDVYFKLLDDLQKLFDREIDLVEREVLTKSENYIRRRHILSTARQVYAA